MLWGEQSQLYNIQGGNESFDRFEAGRVANFMRISYGYVGNTNSYLKAFQDIEPKEAIIKSFGTYPRNIGHSKFLFLSHDNFINDITDPDRMSQRNDNIRLQAMFYPRYIRAHQVKELFYLYVVNSNNRGYWKAKILGAQANDDWEYGYGQTNYMPKSYQFFELFSDRSAQGVPTGCNQQHYRMKIMSSRKSEYSGGPEEIKVSTVTKIN